MSPSPSDGKGEGNALLSRWSDVGRWRELCPHLTISDSVAFGGGSVGGCGKVDTEKIRERLVDDGYALLNHDICSESLRERVRGGISDLEARRLPATFVLLFDQTWELASASHRLLLRNHGQNRGILRANKMAFNFDMLAWNIDPRRDQAGFSPHRDRQPDSVPALKKSFYSDGQAKYVTHWIALSEASPENSCLYVIPREFDPGYANGDDPPEEDVEQQCDESNGANATEHISPLSRALSTKESYQNIRALPRRAGQSLLFTHRIMHWGSRGNKRAIGVEPRTAISFVYSDVEFEPPYLADESFSEDGNQRWKAPPFETRLLLVCAQLLVYYQRFDLSAEAIRACYEYCKANAQKLHESYRKKVFVEFVKAMKEMRDGNNVVDANGSGTNDVGGPGRIDEPNSEDEEALLEEMLDNSDEFDDDFDEMCSDDDPQNGNGSKKARTE